MESSKDPRLPASLWPLLHRLATGDAWPPVDEAGTARFVEAATGEGLLPLLFEEESCPPAVAVALARTRAWAHVFRRRAERHRETLPTLEALLEGEPFILLKGSDYAQRLYPRPALRPMQDIDILVPWNRFPVVCRRLAQAGLVQRFGDDPTHRVASFSEAVFDLGDVTLEVHHSFLPRSRHTVDYDAVWERRLPVEVAGLRLARLGDVDALVYHALSLARDEFFARLIRYVDLWLMLRQAPAILDGAGRRAREWRAVRALYGTLQQAVSLFPELRDELARPAAELLPLATRRFLDVSRRLFDRARTRTGRAEPRDRAGADGGHRDHRRRSPRAAVRMHRG